MTGNQNKMDRGIVIAVPKKYERICLTNIQGIRKLNCMLPVEIWEIGSEISPKTREEFKTIENVTFKNVNDFCDNGSHWKGFQVKAFSLYHTSFKEIMLCDSDILFHQNPGILFEDKNYIESGTYFFRDLEKWQFTKLDNKQEQFRQKFFYNKFSSASFFLKRKKWLTGLLQEKPEFFPEEWDYMYSDKIPDVPVKEALQEAGVVVMNREKQEESVKNIFDLNNNHPETYKYIWGDKETFWIGCLMANKPFYFNPSPGYMSDKTGKLSHDYNGSIFFSQKG